MKVDFVLWLTPLWTCFLGAQGFYLERNAFTGQWPFPFRKPTAIHRSSAAIHARRYTDDDDDYESSARRGKSSKPRHQRGSYKDVYESPKTKTASKSTSKTIPGRTSSSRDVGTDSIRLLNIKLNDLARKKAPERAQELYQRILAEYREGKSKMAPDTCSFNSVLKAWQNNAIGAMKFWDSAGAVKKDVLSYNTYLLALAKAGRYEAAEALLRQMQQKNAQVRPDRVSWNTILRSYANAMYRAGAKDKLQLAERAEAFLRKMMNGVDEDAPDPNYVPPNPDATSFNTVISVWAGYPDVKEAAAKSEYWLHFMQQDDVPVRPDAFTYTTVIKALSRIRSDWVVPRVLALLEEMESTGVSAETITCNMAMDAFCLNRRMDQATRLFETMLALPQRRPDATTYTALMSGWTQYATEADTAAKRAEAVDGVQTFLSQTKQLSQKFPECAPNERTYTSILKIYSESRLPNAGDMACQVLDEMHQANVMPGTIHYNAALLCYTKSTLETKAIEAERLWKEMKQAGVACNTITYTTIINAAANAGGDDVNQRSLEIGLDAFDRLQKDPQCRPTSLSYSCYFNLLQRQLPSTSPLYLPRLKSGFQLCCQQGCLNTIVLQKLLNIVTDNEAQLLFEGNFENRSNVSALPQEWSCNASQ